MTIKKAMISNWYLENTKLIFRHKGKEYFWDMPNGYKLPRPAVLALAEHILLRPYGVNIVVPRVKDHIDYKRTAVAFSGGVDSAAAYNLVNNPQAIYTQVHKPGRLHKLENALMAVEEVSGLRVETNQDLLPIEYGKKRGFYGQAGWTVTSVLLSDYLGVDTFADGNILDFVYLRSKHGHGTLFSRPLFDDIREQFSKVGYTYSLPCAGLTEVSTTKIASNFKYVMGCMRGVEGRPCMTCMKCYRKMALQGVPISTNKEVERVLSKSWIPVLGSLLWARDHCGLNHPRLEKIDKNCDWVDKWYPDSIKYIPKSFQSTFLQRLRDYGVQPLENFESLINFSGQVD